MLLANPDEKNIATKLNGKIEADITVVPPYTYPAPKLISRTCSLFEFFISLSF